MPATAVPPIRFRRSRRTVVAVAALGLTLLAGVVAGEALGWPFLVEPLQRQLSTRLQRQISLTPDPPAAAQPGATLRFIGGLRLQTPQLVVAAPAWSAAPRLLRANDVTLALRYVDLWRAWRGQPLRIDRLQAGTLDAVLERDADGRVSWQFGPTRTPDDAAAKPLPLPNFGQLRVAAGTVRHVDALLALDATFKLSLGEPMAPAPPAVASSVADNSAATNASNSASNSAANKTANKTVNKAANSASNSASNSATDNAAAGPAASVLQVSGRGSLRQMPFTLDLHAAGVMPWAGDLTQSPALPLKLRARIGRAALDFDGTALDLLHLGGLSGRFRLSGPSLAAVGDPLGVTLPSTAPFRANGGIVRQGSIWRVVVDEASVGASRLDGAFSYDTGRSRPLLQGRLGGSRLLLADLGPVVGTTSAVAAVKLPTANASAEPSAPTSPTSPTSPAAQAEAAAAPVPLPASTRGPGKLLPGRQFDLAALRAMDANVLIDLRELDLNTTKLEPLRPLRAHLVLTDGLLRLQDLDARAAQGRLRGELQLDGRGNTALWTTRLQWDGVMLERWIQPPASGPVPAYVSGRLKGQAKLAGQGRDRKSVV